MCDNDKDDKRWKQAIKEAKEEQIKKKSSGYGYHNWNRGRDGYRSGGRSYRRGDSRDRRPDRYVEDAVVGIEGMCTGKRTEPAITVESKDTLRRTVECRGGTVSREEKMSSSGREGFTCDVPDSDINKYLEEKMVFD